MMSEVDEVLEKKKKQKKRNSLKSCVKKLGVLIV